VDILGRGRRRGRDHGFRQEKVTQEDPVESENDSSAEDEANDETPAPRQAASVSGLRGRPDRLGGVWTSLDGEGGEAGTTDFAASQSNPPLISPTYPLPPRCALSRRLRLSETVAQCRPCRPPLFGILVVCVRIERPS
jgi:hypothetical protein